MRMDIIALALILAIVNVTAKQMPSNDYEIQAMLKSILRDYDPKLRPDYLGPPVTVVVDATIIMISNIDEVSMTYTLDMFFRQRWYDHRLKHIMNETLTLIVGTKEPSDIIWVPDTVFIDSVKSHMHHVTVNNHKIDITPNGSVFWGTRVTVSPSCPINLKAYPMDKQICPFEILSYAYTSKHVKYRWKQNPGIKVTITSTAQFLIERFATFEEEIDYVAGKYTVLRGEFHFHRLMGFAILQIFTPSICVVMVSWISLWVKRNAVPARVALCITTLLTISTVWGSINANLPRVNYVKAIDIFMMTSFACVIFTLLEYTVVLNCTYILQAVKRHKEKRSVSKEMTNFLNVTNAVPLVDTKGNPWPLTGPDQMRFRQSTNRISMKKKKDSLKDEAGISEEIEKLADKIENSARIFFPLFYAFFLIFYFYFYLKE